MVLQKLRTQILCKSIDPSGDDASSYMQSDAWICQLFISHNTWTSNSFAFPFRLLSIKAVAFVPLQKCNARTVYSLQDLFASVLDSVDRIPNTLDAFTSLWLINFISLFGLFPTFHIRIHNLKLSYHTNESFCDIPLLFGWFHAQNPWLFLFGAKYVRNKQNSLLQSEGYSSDLPTLLPVFLQKCMD